MRQRLLESKLAQSEDVSPKMNWLKTPAWQKQPDYW